MRLMLNDFKKVEKPVIVEGAGGVLVPINSKEFVIDLIKLLKLKIYYLFFDMNHSFQEILVIPHILFILI